MDNENHYAGWTAHQPTAEEVEEHTSAFDERWNKFDSRWDGIPDEPAKVATWRRLLLADMVRGMDVHKMSPLLLDQAIDKILTADREEILRFFGLLKEDGLGR